MTASYEHPTLKMTVTPEQRDRAAAWLQQAYAENRLSEDEFDHRIGRVLSAANRRELNDAFYGLVEVPVASQALGVHPAYQPLVRPELRQQVGRGAAAVAHFSVFLLWILGPLIVFGLSAPGSYARREAAKAFNFQLVSSVAFVGTGILSTLPGLHVLHTVLALMTLAWVVLTVGGGAKALQGDDWTNPVKRVARVQVLSER